MNTNTAAVEDETGALVLTDSRVDPDKFLLDGIDTSKEPLYPVGEMAKFFFARSSHWVRWLERNDKMLLDGQPVAQERSDAGMRQYTLSDIERLAHALAANGAINGAQLRLSLAAVVSQAELYGYL